MLANIFSNHVLIPALTAWWMAQFIKPFIEYPISHEWNFGMWFSSGGMPSSHSSLIIATMLSIGLYEGFDSPLFALSVALAMIVTYDAAGVRRQAGMQAHKINQLINELLSGHPISEKQLKEVLGHTPWQVAAGALLGIITALTFWLIWP